MRLGWAFRCGFLVLATLSAACGDDDDDEKPAVAQCKRFGSTWCKRALDCLVTLGTLPQAQYASNLDVCVDTATAAAQCKRAVSVQSSYAQCLSEMESMECSRWNVPMSQLSTVPPPESCRGVILIR